MFGYITIHKPDLKFKEYDVYRAYYCGLCHTLKEKFNQTSRFSLNYDLTYLSILLSSLYEPKTQEKIEHCIIHPITKHPYYQNECIDYASKMTIVLTYLKCLDDWNDEKKMLQNIYGKMLHKYYLQVKEEYPLKVQNIEKELEVISQIEKKGDLKIDFIASHFGKVMGEICCYQDDEWKDELYELGFYLGKFIYMMDAYDDIETDIKKGNYNPLLEKYKDSDFEDYCHEILELMISKVATVFECLPIIENVEILRNILYSGVWTRYELRRKQRMEDMQ